MFLHAQIGCRAEFPQLCNERSLVGVAVEIGTFRGQFAAQFAKIWHGKMLYCIDPWENLPGYEEQGEILQSVNMGGGKDRNEDYVATMKALDKWKNRTTLVRATSEDAVQHFKDQSVDFVYIDGDHRYKMVKQDIELWWPKLKNNGILAGHDFLCPGEKDGLWGPGIQKALIEFFPWEQVIRVCWEPHGLPWSWYAQKNEQLTPGTGR